MRVLILEDQPLIAMDIEEGLVANNFEIAAVLSSCASALEWLEAGSCEVAILDIELRDGICVDVAAALSDRQIPFVVHSGSPPHSPNLDPVFQRGGWVTKPSSETDLIAAIFAAATQGRLATNMCRDTHIAGTTRR